MFLCLSARAQTIAVAFYNFENLFDPYDDPANRGDDDFTPQGSYHYTETIYRQKLHNIATVLQQLGSPRSPDGPALIATAEIENDRVLEDLCRQPELAPRQYRFVHFDSRDARGIDVALLYRPALFRLLEAHPVPVDISRFGQKEGHTRDILHVTGILAGDTVHVLVNHWPSRRGGEEASRPLRALAASVNQAIVDSVAHADPGARILVMGDLNDDPESPSIRQSMRTRRTAEAVPADGLFNPWIDLLRRGVGTLAYKDGWNLFDQIMLNGNCMRKGARHWAYRDAEVFNQAFLQTAFGPYRGYPHRSFEGNRWIDGYSDHFPVLVYLSR